MKKYNAIAIIDGYEDELFVCELTADDVAKAEVELSHYMQCKGKIYDLDENKTPRINNFFKLYFGKFDDDDLFRWIAPNRYVCTNKNVADRFMKLAKKMEYHNTFNQTYCTVEQDGKVIDVFYGDY